MPERAMARIWESSSPAARAARAALPPASWGYGGGRRRPQRGVRRGWLRSHALALPSVSVGNLTVGGTGKTPVSAYIAARLVERGLKPAIVMRGYGNDEALVHARLNPDVPVVIAADRVRGALDARAMGCDVAVLDDAFQHRRAKRDADIVLFRRIHGARPPRCRRVRGANRWVAGARVADRRDAKECVAGARTRTAHARAAVCAAGWWRDRPPRGGGAWQRGDSGEDADVSVLRDKSVLAVAAIGDPRAFAAQVAERAGSVISSPSAIITPGRRRTRRRGPPRGRGRHGRSAR